jgi:hypothetical protein
MENKSRIMLLLECNARNNNINSGSKDTHDETNICQ